MNRGDFLAYLSNPTNVSPSDGRDLEGILDLYPYFQGAHILYALTLNSNNDIRFNDALRNAALHTGNRKVLFRFLHESPPSKTEEKEEIVEDSHLLSEEMISDLDSIPEPEKEVLLEEKVLASNQVKIVLPKEQLEREPQEVPIEEHEVSNIEYNPTPKIGKHSFSDWLKTIQANKIVTEQDASKRLSENESISEVDKEELIEKFIKAEPRISKPAKAEFFSPIQMAKKSVEDSDDIVSETLAKIYATQGNPTRAIRIYQKLSLLNPDKSGYFAALIQKLENPDLL
jgi:hypothetical protein